MLEWLYLQTRHTNSKIRNKQKHRAKKERGGKSSERSGEVENVANFTVDGEALVKKGRTLTLFFVASKMPSHNEHSSAEAEVMRRTFLWPHREVKVLLKKSNG